MARLRAKEKESCCFCSQPVLWEAAGQAEDRLPGWSLAPPREVSAVFCGGHDPVDSLSPLPFQSIVSCNPGVCLNCITKVLLKETRVSTSSFAIYSCLPRMQQGRKHAQKDALVASTNETVTPSPGLRRTFLLYQLVGI